MEITKIGLIGAGNSAKNIAKSISTLTNAKLIQVAAKTIEEAKVIADIYNIPASDNYKKILENPEIQAIVVSVPHNLHHPITMDCLNAGKHVLCEKPLAVNMTQGLEMINRAKEKKLILGTFFQNRFNQASIEAKKIVDTGALGKILHAQVNVFWSRDQKYYDESPWRGKWATEGGGSLINQAIHTIDLMIWLIGKPKTVYGMFGAKTHKIEVDDNAAAVLRFDNDVYATIQTSTSTDPGFPSMINIYGSDGMVAIDGNKIKIVKKSGTQEMDFEGDKVASANDPTKFALKSHQALIQDFIDAVQKNHAPKIDGYEGLRAIQIVQAIYQSNGEKVIHLQDF